MIYLILAIISSTIISIFMRCSEHYISAKIPMLSVNYLACMVLAVLRSNGAVLTLPQTQTALTLGLGLINGAIYLLALVLIQYTMRINGVVLSSVFSKMGGLIVPLAVSIGLFREAPTWVQLCGTALSALAIFLLTGYSTENKIIGTGSLMLLFLMQGTASAMSKVFEHLIGAAQFNHFLFYTFGFAMLLSIGLCIRKKERPGKWEILFGLLIGIPNFFSASLLLLALEALPAVIVYPTTGVGGIMILSLAGVVLFHERLEKKQWLGILTVVVSVFLLNL